MFGHRYFGAHYFGPRYFGGPASEEEVVVPPVQETVSGGFRQSDFPDFAPPIVIDAIAEGDLLKVRYRIIPGMAGALTLVTGNASGGAKAMGHDFVLGVTIKSGNALTPPTAEEMFLIMAA